MTDAEQPTWRNAIIRTAEAPPGDLIPRPLNWWLHPVFLQQALAGVFSMSLVLPSLGGRGLIVMAPTGSDCWRSASMISARRSRFGPAGRSSRDGPAALLPVSSP